MLEKEIEAYLVREVKKHDGVAYKFTSPANRGVPDRIVVLPGGQIFFVEVKNEKGRLSALQTQTIKKLRELECNVLVVFSKSDVDEFISMVSDLVETHQLTAALNEE